MGEGGDDSGSTEGRKGMKGACTVGYGSREAELAGTATGIGCYERVPRKGTRSRERIVSPLGGLRHYDAGRGGCFIGATNVIPRLAVGNSLGRRLVDPWSGSVSEGLDKHAGWLLVKLEEIVRGVTGQGVG